MVDDKVPQDCDKLGSPPAHHNVHSSFEEMFRHNDFSLFLELAEANLYAASIFAIADLRSLAHRNLVSKEEAEEILKLPVNGTHLRSLYQKHGEFSKKFRSRDFLSFSEKYLKLHGVPPGSLTVEYVGDANAESECVHLVGHHSFRQIIMVVFRGSITVSDWIQDIKLMIAKVPNPLQGVEGQPDTVGIHWGFRTYMYGSSERLAKVLSNAKTILSRDTSGGGTRSDSSSHHDGDEENPTKIGIVLEQLREVKRKFPSYPIYIIGHSLGGALALITALSVAADPELSKLPECAPKDMTPVSVFGIGNPKPGDRAFCNAIRHLESTKTLRCLCVHNCRDVVPMLATNVAMTDIGFWHPGFRLFLYKNRFELGRSDELASRIQESSNGGACCGGGGGGGRKGKESLWTMPDSFNPITAAKNMTPKRMNLHDYREYFERILAQSDRLSSINLTEFYKDVVWVDAINDVCEEDEA